MNKISIGDIITVTGKVTGFTSVKGGSSYSIGIDAKSEKIAVVREKFSVGDVVSLNFTKGCACHACQNLHFGGLCTISVIGPNDVLYVKFPNGIETHAHEDHFTNSTLEERVKFWGAAQKQKDSANLRDILSRMSTSDMTATFLEALNKKNEEAKVAEAKENEEIKGEKEEKK